MFSVLLAFCEWNLLVIAGFHSKRSNNSHFLKFSVLCLKKRLNTQLSCGWFETLWPSCEVIVMLVISSSSELAQKLPIAVNQMTFDSPHTKTHLLFQSHFCEQALPSSDYYTDTKSVLDQAIRILQVYRGVRWMSWTHFVPVMPYNHIDLGQSRFK